MRQKYAIVLLMLLMLSLLSLSGCISTGSGGSATPTIQYETGSTATPTAQYPTGPTATPIVSESTGNGHLLRVSQMINADNLHTYKYRVSQSINGINKAFETEITYSDATYKCEDAKLTTVTQYIPGSNGTYIAETPTYVYMSKTNGNVLGGTNTIFINGQPTDQDMSINDATNVLLSDIANNAIMNGDIALTYVGPETITVDDKTYDCTRYSNPIGNTTEIEWYTPHAPMPVKSLWAPIGNYTQITELLSWS